MSTIEQGGSTLLHETTGRRIGSRSVHVEVIILAAAIAVSAIDLPRLTSGVTGLRALQAITFVALFGVIARHPPALSRRWPPVLLASWIGWALLAPIGGAPLASFVTTVRFGAILAVVAGLSAAVPPREAPTIFARTIVVAFGGYLAASAVLVGGGALTVQVNDRFTLASLESNQLGRAAALAAVSGLWMLARDVRVWSLIGGGGAVVGGAITLATESRTALAALGCGVVVLAIHTSRGRLVALALGAALTIITAWIAGFLTLGDIVPAADRVTVQGDSGSSTTLSGRETLWPRLWIEVEQSPIVGHGLGNDRSIIVDRLDVGWEALHAHNLVVHAALTTGLIGVAILLAAIFSAMSAAALAPRPFALALLVIVILDGISEPVVRIPAFGWLALCAAVVVATLEHKNE